MSTMNYLWTICSHPAFANQSIKANVLIKVTKTVAWETLKSVWTNIANSWVEWRLK